MRSGTVTIGTWNCEAGFSKKTRRLQYLLRRESKVDVWLLQGVPSVDALCSDIDPGWNVIAPKKGKWYENTDTVILYRDKQFSVTEEAHEVYHYGEYNWLRVPRIRYKQTAVLHSKDGGGHIAVGNIHMTSKFEATKHVENYVDWAEEVCADGQTKFCAIGGSWGQRYFSGIWGELMWRKLRMVFAHVQMLQVTGYADVASNMAVVSRREVPMKHGVNAVIVRYAVTNPEVVIPTSVLKIEEKLASEE